MKPFGFLGISYYFSTLFQEMNWRRTQVAKGAVCKTVIHRFKSGRRLVFFSAEVAEMVDARDLKSLDPFGSYRFDSGLRHTH